MSVPPASTSQASGPVGRPVGLQAVTRKKPAVNIFTKTKKKPVTRNGAPIKPPPSSQRPSKTAAAPKASDAPTKPRDSFPIFVRKKDMDLRYHIMKFQGQALVNPYDENQFSRPIRLFRRSAAEKAETAEQSDITEGVHGAEREQLEARREARQAEKEENQKLIAPTGGDNASKPVNKPKQKKFVNFDNDNFPERQRRQQLRYEEARPWHIEDYDKQNMWVGSYEAPLSNQHALLMVEEGGFRMVPAEKYYRFAPTGKFDTMDLEEATRHMNQKFGMLPKWAANSKMGADMARKQAMQMKNDAFEARRRADRDSGDEDKFADQADYQADKDALDIEWDNMDEFQDDDEGKLIETGEDEDMKEVHQRLREEMRQAGLGGTGVKDEDFDPEEEYRRQQMQEREERKRTKRLRKQLGRREKKNEYLSDSDEDPYSDESDDSLEIEEDEEEKKAQEANKLNVPTGDKSGASTRGNNTPTGRVEKREPVRSNKRPGSPDVSDMSGNESSRKKAKGLNGRPAKPSLRPGSPRASSGSGDESDASRASGRPKSKALPSPNGTPVRSRATSPSAGGPPAKRELPTLDEIRAAIPQEGIKLSGMAVRFKSQVHKDNSPAFIKMVCMVGHMRTVEGAHVIFPRAA